MAVENRKFSVNIPNVSNQWIHLVLNFIGLNSGDGIQAFRDGVLEEVPRVERPAPTQWEIVE